MDGTKYENPRRPYRNSLIYSVCPDYAVTTRHRQDGLMNYVLIT